MKTTESINPKTPQTQSENFLTRMVGTHLGIEERFLEHNNLYDTTSQVSSLFWHHYKVFHSTEVPSSNAVNVTEASRTGVTMMRSSQAAWSSKWTFRCHPLGMPSYTPAANMPITHIRTCYQLPWHVNCILWQSETQNWQVLQILTVTQFT